MRAVHCDCRATLASFTNARLFQMGQPPAHPGNIAKERKRQPVDDGTLGKPASPVPFADRGRGLDRSARGGYANFNRVPIVQGRWVVAAQCVSGNVTGTNWSFSVIRIS
jgi:hypothetical protein